MKEDEFLNRGKANIKSTSFDGLEYKIQETINKLDILKAKIAENPNAIRDLFTDAEKGLATLMNEAIDKAAKASSVNPGSLVAMAGAKGMPSSDSTIARQMKLIDDSLKNLNNKYQSEYDRYWKQFNSMEQMIQKMNSQSSWLSQQFSG